MVVTKPGIGNRIAPPRFILFVILLVAGDAAGASFLGLRHGLMAGFDVAAAIFMLSLLPVLRGGPAQMRDLSEKNDANRALLLGLTGAVVAVILVTVAAELIDRRAANGGWAKA